MSQPSDVEIVQVREGVSFGVHEEVLVLAYATAPTVSDLRRREPLLARLVEAHGRVAFLSILDTRTGTGLPDAASRAETTRQLTRFGGSLAAGAVVLLGDGMRISLVRGFLRGVLLMKGGPFPHRFFAEVPPAARFCLDALRRSDGDAVPRLVRACDAVIAASKGTG